MYRDFRPIGFCSVEIHLPDSHSLKEKWSALRRVVDRFRSRFNFSISEIEHQELWQRARVGRSLLASHSKSVGRISN